MLPAYVMFSSVCIIWITTSAAPIHVESICLVNTSCSSEVTILPNTSFIMQFHGEAFVDDVEVAFARAAKLTEETTLLNVAGKWKLLNASVAEIEINLPSTKYGGFYYLYTRTLTDKWMMQDERFVVKVAQREINAASIWGISVQNGDSFISSAGIAVLYEHVDSLLRLFGDNFVPETTIALTEYKGKRNSRCDGMPIQVILNIPRNGYISSSVIEIPVKLPSPFDKHYYYFCVKETRNYGQIVKWIHQGDDKAVIIEVKRQIIPLGFRIISIVILLLLSGLFSGLNLGLLCLDVHDLLVLYSCGTDSEKLYARTILPIRRKGNFLLCTILFGNALVNSTLVILISTISSGLMTFILSTATILVLGEIIPQAMCSRFGLAIGAKTVYITKFFMFLTFPLSYPVSKLLNLALKEEVCHIYGRDRLMEFIKLNKTYMELQEDEVDIISGALNLKKTTVKEIMTKIDDVFMLPYDAILDFETLSEIAKNGYSRIPVYENDRKNVVSILNVKNLTILDPDDHIPVKTVCAIADHPLIYVREDATLHIILEEFKKGYSHMGFVCQFDDSSNEGTIIGVVTMEDIIEEIIQSEIFDETDIFTDNTGKRRISGRVKWDFSDFVRIGNRQNNISAQTAYETCQFLLTSVQPFKQHITKEMLLSLMAENIFVKFKKPRDSSTWASIELYRCNKAADYFILILEGRVTVTASNENLRFDAGPFSYFGTAALIVDEGISESARLPFIPDYTVTVNDDVVYMKVTRQLYLNAYYSSLQRMKGHPGSKRHSKPVQRFVTGSTKSATKIGGGTTF